jgi:hypothetical protein
MNDVKRYRHEPAFMVVDQGGEYVKAEELVSTRLMYERASADGIAEAHKCFDLQTRVDTLERALRKISAIEDSLHGGDWDEIEEARTIANAALEVN